MSINLQQLGFNENEAKAYETLLKRGPMKPAQLAAAIKINRTTLYSVAKKLMAKGLISEDVAGQTGKLIPNDPKNLRDLLERERAQLEEKEVVTQHVIEELSLITSKETLPVPKIRFIPEDQVEDFLFTQSRTWHESAQQYDGMWWGFQDKSFTARYERWIDWVWKHIFGEQGAVRQLTNDSETEQDIKKRLGKKYPGRQSRQLTDDSDFTASIWAVGDYIIMISTEDSPYLVEMHDKTLAQNLRATYKNLWKLAK